MNKQEAIATLQTVGLKAKYSGRDHTLYVEGKPSTDIVKTVAEQSDGFKVLLNGKAALEGAKKTRKKSSTVSM